MKTPRLLALPLLLLTVIASAQEAPKMPFEWKVSGDTVETFKLEFKALRPIDQSSAKALVESYAAYTDNRDEISKAMDVVGEKWDAALARSIQSYETKLIAPEFIKKRETKTDEKKAEATYTAKREAMTVTGESVDEKGITWVEAKQVVKIHQKDWQTEEWKDSVEEQLTRFACEKSEDGKWLINRIEMQVKDWQNMKEDGEVPMVWKEQAGMLDFMVFYRQQYEQRKALPALKQDTPENAAKSLFNHLIPKREELGNSIHSKGLKGWTDALEVMFSKKHAEARDARFKEWAEGDSDKQAREVESVTDGKDGVKIVRFKKRDEWSGAVEVHLKSFEGSWKIINAGYFETAYSEDGKTKENFISEPDVYALEWR